MMLETGRYEINSKIHETRNPKDLVCGEFNDISNDMFISFLVDDIKLSKVDDLNLSKLYYHPVQDVTKDEFPKTRLLKSFDLYRLYDCNYIQDNFIHFDIDGKKYSLVTNAEYILQISPHMNSYSIMIYFGDSSLKDAAKKFYSMEEGAVNFKRSNHVYLPKPVNPTIKMMDYFVLDGYRFSDTYDDTYIDDTKETLTDLLSEYRWYFLGTSIFDYARDIDIQVHPDDYDDIIDTLVNSGFEQRTHQIGHGGAMFRIPNKKVKLDIIRSDYTQFQEPTNGRNADPLFSYFTQSNYYTSICRDNVSELFKEYRFNKIIDTKERIGIDYTQPYYKNTYMSKERFKNYYDILNDNFEVVTEDIFTNKTCSAVYVKKDEWGYLIMKSHYIDQMLTVELPFVIKSFDVLDGEDCNSIISRVVEDKTSIKVLNCNSYALIKFKQ